MFTMVPPQIKHKWLCQHATSAMTSQCAMRQLLHMSDALEAVTQRRIDDQLHQPCLKSTLG